MPNLHLKTIAVKTEVKYRLLKMAIDVFSEPLRSENFAVELHLAIKRNLKVLQDCQYKNAPQCSKAFILCLSEREMSVFGCNPVQRYAKFGLLFGEGKTYCCTKPKYENTLSTLLALHHRKPLDFSIEYKFHQEVPNVFTYEKVKYGPLQYKDAVKCLYDLLTKLKVVCESLACQSICHNDIRIPNICFNEPFEIVLIDFDKTTLSEGNSFMDLSVQS